MPGAVLVLLAWLQAWLQAFLLAWPRQQASRRLRLVESQSEIDKRSSSARQARQIDPYAKASAEAYSLAAYQQST